MFAAYKLPDLCRETGLSCEACTEHTALQLSRVCQGLQGKALGQMFVQLYPENSCAPMHTHFAAAYRQASEARSEDVPRRGVSGERPFFHSLSATA